MSGLPDWLEDRARGKLPLIDRLFAGNDRSFDIEAVAAVVRDELTPHFPPQDLHAAKPLVRYSDTGFQLLMAIIESVTGRKLPDIYRQEIIDPLGLLSTWLPECPPGDTPIAPSTLWAGDQLLELPLALESIRDIYSTTADLILFLRAVVSGSLFENPQTAAIMYGNFRRFSRFWDRSAFRLPQSPIEYGAGMMRLALPRALTPLRRIPAVIGHTGSTGSWLFYCRELDLYLAGCVDQATAAPLPFRFVPRVLHEIAARKL
ncbi:MAG: class A beta-lactamase-related serine hydrolase [Spirochaetaceae bacterium]|nr:MAG: class A beta-lactamase-related serine hydrolase [Spirochaetaceae bacterium]